MPINRRGFLKAAGPGITALACAPHLWAQKRIALPPIKSTYNGVVVGCNTYSFSESSLDEAVKNIASIGFGEAELHPRHVEPTFGAPGRRPAGSSYTPEEQKAAAEAREKLRYWRLNEPMSTFEGIGRKFKDAGLFLLAY